jgi:hypothetical protein
MDDFGAEAGKSKGGNNALKIAGIIAGLIVTCCIGIVVCAVGIFGMTFAIIQQSEPYQVGVERALNDTAVVEALGAPVEAGWNISGSVNQDTSGGTANFEVPLEGSRTSGVLYVDAVNQNGTWEYLTFEVEIPSQGTTIDLR